MAQNYILLETIELTQSAASVTFDLAGISGYTDLKVVYSTRTTAASTSGNDIISINGSGASFTGRRIYGSGSAAASDTVTTWAGFNSANNGTASTFGNTEVYFPNAFGSTYKSYSIDTVQEQNGTTAYSALSAGLWSIIDAITSITLTPDSGNYAQHSTFSLYGVAALGTTPVTGPGGYKAANSFAISSSLTVTVGAGGAGQTTYPSIGRGANGSNSVLSSITSTGGGGGSQGGATGKPGGSGGSGGGSGGTNGGSPLNPIGTASPAGQGSDGGQGNNGGSGSGRGGGGGGASATGASGTTSGAGGAGTSNSISGSAVTYAGGGGSGSYETTAGAGGAGGGGAGGRYAPPTVGGAGTTNTGGGGGGGSAGSAYGGNGASGIVIIRYAMA